MILLNTARLTAEGHFDRKKSALEDHELNAALLGVLS